MPAVAASGTYKPINLVKAFSVILKGRNRYLRISLLLNKYTNCRASGSAITHLESFLQHKFGPTAVGVLVGDCVYKNDEEMMRDSLIKTDDAYYVLYEDYTPPYAECMLQPPMYHDARTSIEGHTRDTVPNYHEPLVSGYLKPAYFDELVYYPQIPLVTKTFSIKLSFGRKASITLSNLCVEHADNFRHALYLKAGYKAQGIQGADGTIYRNDEVLFNDDIVEGGTYKLVRGVGYAINAPAQERAPPPSARSNRPSADGLRRLSSSAIQRVASRSSTSSREAQSRSIRVK